MYLENEQATHLYAQQFAATLKAGDCIALTGDLGAGKSTFARSMMRALGVKDDIMPSPTFALIQTYHGSTFPIAHMDWYRLADSEEIILAGAEEYFVKPWLSLIEWPQAAWSLLPTHTQHIHLAYGKTCNERLLTHNITQPS